MTVTLGREKKIWNTRRERYGPTGFKDPKDQRVTPSGVAKRAFSMRQTWAWKRVGTALEGLFRIKPEKCPYCHRQFDSIRGLAVHASKTHKRALPWKFVLGAARDKPRVNIDSLEGRSDFNMVWFYRNNLKDMSNGRGELGKNQVTALIRRGILSGKGYWNGRRLTPKGAMLLEMALNGP